MSDAQESASERRGARVGRALGWVALLLILGGALGRASVNADPFPHWDSDPLMAPSVKTGWGPTFRMALDVLALIGCASAVASACLMGGRIRARMLVLLGIGGAAVILHAYVLPADPLAPDSRGELEDLIVGGSWLAALGGAVGLAHLRGRARRIGLAIALGFVVMLAGKGAAQRYVEHPMTVRDYDAQRESILAARGWRPDSAQALAYERRLRQNDASGWFGLSNVYATFGALGLVTGAGLGFAAFRRREKLIGGMLLLGGACGLAMLLMSHSKGGMGAAAFGMAITLLLGSGRVHGRWARLMLAMVPAGVLAIVIGRGLLGERLGELSLLFRWHYMQGSARIILEHPLLGVGPSGFKEAYLLTRPPLGVEEVTSPHSVLLDWVSTLGVFGIAWGGLGLLLVMGSVKDTASKSDEPEAGTSREDAMLIALGCAGITGLSAITESAMATPEGAMFRVLGLVGWVAVAAAIARVLRDREESPWIRAAVAGGVGAIAAHSMIEVTPVWANSAALLGAVLGLSCGEPDGTEHRPLRATFAVGVGLPLLGALGLGLALPALYRWERSLDAASAEVRSAAQLRDRLGRIGAGVGLVGDTLDQVRADIAAALGEPAAPSQGVLIDQLRRLSAREGEMAFEALGPAIEARPMHVPTARAAARLSLGIAEFVDPEQAPSWREQAVQTAQGVSDRRPGSSTAWASLGSISHGAWSRSQDTDDLRRARDAWARAFELDPLSLSLSVRLMDVSDQLGEPDEAARWAGIALELDGLKRLDPLKQLSDRDRARGQRLGRAGPGSGP